MDDDVDHKKPMQAAGNDGRDRAPDGVDRGGGQSEGGAYPNPHAGKKGSESGFLGHGGQSQHDYSGPADKDDPDGNPNAVTGGD